MKISTATINILKNFAGINNNILLKPGKVISTISTKKSTFAEATIAEDFPNFGIFDLSQFLNILGFYNEPDIKFDDAGKYAVISSVTDKDAKFRYMASDQSCLTVPKRSWVPEESQIAIKFSLDESQIENIMKASAILSLTDLVIASDGDTLSIKIFNASNSTKNEFVLPLGKGNGKGNGKVFDQIFNIENMKFIGGSYDVAVVPQAAAQFTSKSGGLRYVMTCSPNSTYSEA